MVDKVTDQSILEPLSALMDNEASELELHRILKQSEADDSLKQQWSRYQMAASAMRKEVSEGPFMDLSASISAAIDAEEAHQMPDSDESSPKKTGFLHSIGRFAIAASVAGAVIISVQTTQQGGDVAEVASHSLDAAPSSLSLPAGYKAPELSARTVSVDPSAKDFTQRETRNIILLPKKANVPVTDKGIHKQLNQYISEHSEHAALNSGRGMMPFARVAPTENE